ncbi:MAG: lipoprotein, partial [Candidatus Marinimicrobia bacterium]|nr:lipoprotein [Candidatus Neomarinimicrobiota bacterium]
MKRSIPFVLLLFILTGCSTMLYQTQTPLPLPEIDRI